MKFETRAIHKGQPSDPRTGAVIVPVYQTSTYEQDGIGKDRGFEYSRTGNPTRKALEDALASLEGAEYGLAFASGMAAIDVVIRTLKPGAHVVCWDDLYGGTFRLLEQVYRPWGVNTEYAGDVKTLEKKIRKDTGLIWLETPTNPLLKIADIEKISVIAQKHKIPVVVDNTFATPYLQSPLSLGADIVVHSTTKYLAGHSDVIGGAVLTNNEDIYKKVKFLQNAAGSVPAPWDCWLTLRGIKTLSVRMREHCRNAKEVAEFLESHPKVEQVYYPGLKKSPDYHLAKKQMSGFGGMVSFEIKGGKKAAERFFKRIKVFILAESLGGVESLACYPPAMTHGSLSPQERALRGIKDNLIRLSVGIEHIDDLIADLDQALE